MHRTYVPFLTALCFTVGAPPVLAQQFGAAGHLGTMGIGASGGIGLSKRIGLRMGANMILVSPTVTVSDINYSIDPPDPQFQAAVDVFVVGALRISGGVFVSPADLISTSDQSGSGAVTVGGMSFTGTDVGTVTGTVINNDVSPYIGVGVGRVGGNRRVGFFLDVGIALQGRPVVSLQADGAAANNPLFQQALRNEEDEMEEALKLFRFYPIVSIGLSIGL